MQRYIRVKELSEILSGRSRGAINLDVAAKRLPKPIKLGGVLLWGEDDLKEFLSHKSEVDASISKLPESWVIEVAGMICPIDMREKSEFYLCAEENSAKCENLEIARNCLAVNILTMLPYKSDLTDQVVEGVKGRITDPNWVSYPRSLSLDCYNATRLFMGDRKGRDASNYVNRDDIAALVKIHLNDRQDGFSPVPYVSERGKVTHDGSKDFASYNDRKMSVTARDVWDGAHKCKVNAAHKAAKSAAKEAAKVILRTHFINALKYS